MTLEGEAFSGTLFSDSSMASLDNAGGRRLLVMTFLTDAGERDTGDENPDSVVSLDAGPISSKTSRSTLLL